MLVNGYSSLKNEESFILGERIYPSTNSNRGNNQRRLSETSNLEREVDDFFISAHLDNEEIGYEYQ